MLNNGPEPDTAIYDGTNNGLGLTEFTAQIMRFDVNPLPVGQVAQPFTPARQAALDAALTANYAATVTPIVPVPTARQVGTLRAYILLLYPTLDHHNFEWLTHWLAALPVSTDGYHATSHYAIAQLASGEARGQSPPLLASPERREADGSASTIAKAKAIQKR
jgi:hypothetical protein